MSEMDTCKELMERIRELEQAEVERNHLVTELRKSEQRYRTILDTIEEAYYENDVQGRLTFFNDSLCRISGYSRYELQGANIRQYTDQETAREGTKVFNQVYRTGKAVKGFEWEITRKDGKKARVEASVSPLMDAEGRCVGFCGIIRDVSERKRTEEALKQSREKLRSIIEHSNELFYIHDIQHRFTYVSPNSKSILGYTSEEMKRKWTEFVTDNPMNKKGFEITDKAIKTGERQNPYLLELEKKNGELVLLEIDESPVKDASGKVVSITGAARDVTERKKSEERLLKSEKKFRDLFDSITDLIYTQDLEGRFLSVNRAMGAAFGYEKDELIGRLASDFMKPEMGPLFKLEYLEKIKTKGYHEGISAYFAKNGKRIYIDYRSALVEPDDGAPYITGTGRDVTEQVLAKREIKRLQNQMAHSQKMKSLGLMAGGIAHDLNNILSGIVSYPDLILMDLPEDSPIRKPIKTIQESGMRAADVVADLLTVARGVATGREICNLNSLITDYMNSPEHQRLVAIHAAVVFETLFAHDLLNIRCSPIHIQKTLMNLISNASEAIDGAGTVTISTSNRYLDGRLEGYEDIHSGEYVLLTVADTGLGISPADLERIFEPFYTKKVLGRSGTGLGLAVVWNTVQDHEGHIKVKSGKQGTVFELFFPVIREEAKATGKEKVALESYAGDGERILVVDDEERQREIACKMLVRLGYQAIAVSSGEEAVDYLREHTADLVILDMIMPKGKNGRETYDDILKIRPGQRAIIASGYAKTTEVDMTRKLGAGKYVKKPYTLEKIGLAVREELQKQN